VQEAKESNTLGVLVFGSVASGTHRENSDIDLILVYEKHEPTSGMIDVEVEGIKVGRTFFAYEVIAQGVDTVPYLLHMVVNAKLLFDRNGTIAPLIGRIKEYFEENPDVQEEWNRIYDRFREEKRQFGFEKTTIIDVFDELEGKFSGGTMKRTFFTTESTLPARPEECRGNNDNVITRITRAVGQLFDGSKRGDS
jgi:predicted nucleotidyltransferase